MKANGKKAKIRKVLKNIGKPRKSDGKPMTITEAGIEAGYSPSYARSGHLTSTAEWLKQMNLALPDDLLLKVHKEGLKSKTVLYATNDGVISDTKEIPDRTNRHRYLESAYKLKKRYEETINLNGKFTGISDAEIEGRIAGIISGIIGSIAGTGKTKGK